MSVVFNRRKNTTAAYDQAVIDLLEGQGLTVDVIDDGDFSGYDFSDVELVVIGAPDTDWVSSHTSSSIIAGLDCHVLSFCRGASRNTLDIGSSSGSTNVGSFTVVDGDHPVMQALGWTSGSFSMGPNYNSHRISSLASATDLIMHNGSSGNAGLAELIMGDYSKFHFGYHRIDDASQECVDLLLELIEYMEVISGENLRVEAPGEVRLVDEYEKYGVQAAVMRTTSGFWEAQVALERAILAGRAESISEAFAADVVIDIEIQPNFFMFSSSRMRPAQIDTTSSVAISADRLESISRVYRLSEILTDKSVMFVAPVAKSQSKMEPAEIMAGMSVVINAEVMRSRQAGMDATFISNILDNFGWNDEVMLILQDEGGGMKLFRGVIRDIEDSDRYVDVEVFLADGILSERIIREDYIEQDIGLTAQEIISEYCRPITTGNINVNTGISAPIKAEGKTPVQVFEEMRRNHGINFYVDNMWDMHLYREDQVITDEEDPFILRLGE